MAVNDVTVKKCYLGDSDVLPRTLSTSWPDLVELESEWCVHVEVFYNQSIEAIEGVLARGIGIFFVTSLICVVR